MKRKKKEKRTPRQIQPTRVIVFHIYIERTPVNIVSYLVRTEQKALSVLNKVFQTMFIVLNSTFLYCTKPLWKHIRWMLRFPITNPTFDPPGALRDLRFLASIIVSAL